MSSTAVPAGYALEVDPSASGAIVRFFFILETIVNVVEVTFFLLYPNKFLSLMVSDPSSIQPIAETLMRLIGICMLTVTVPLAMGSLNTPFGIEIRRGTYWMYVFVEVTVVFTFRYFAALGEERVGLKPEALVFIANQLTPLIFGRLLPLVWRPEWMGRCRVVSAKRAN